MVGSSIRETQPANQTEADIQAGKSSQRARRPKGKIVIFGTWCKGCGICVAFCPTEVLALDVDGHPLVVAPEKCTACHWCDTHCPDLAIVVRRIEE